MLDFGCGPGRDLKALGELGHIAVGLEGAARLAVMTPELGSLTAQLRETRGESCRALLTADVSSRMHATTDTVLASALVTLFMTIPTFLIFGVNVRFWPKAVIRNLRARRLAARLLAGPRSSPRTQKYRRQ